MASIHRPLGGPFMKHGFCKSVYKGEDTSSQHPATKIDLPGTPDPVEAGVFGVFDGHGGKQAAVYAAKNLLAEVIADVPNHMTSVAEPGEGPYDRVKALSSVPDPTLREWELQDAVVKALPAAFVTAFSSLNDKYIAAHKVAGTTATLAVVVGWDLLVANVGDSCAYLDTGSEVIQVSGNHRLDGNKVEIERCRAAGCEVSASVLEGKSVGPLRVWPGGLAMSRTLGDADAGEVVVAEPEVRHVTIPLSGARLIMASDGLWDAVNYKTAAHHVRGQPASKAAPALVQQALKARGLRDDISVLVVDLVPDEGARMPLPLEKGAVHPAHIDAVLVHKPLECDSQSWTNHSWERRLAIARAHFGVPAQEATSMTEDSSMSHIFYMTDVDSASISDPLSATESGYLAESAESIVFGSFDMDAMDGFPAQESEEDEESGWETVAQKPRKKDIPSPAPHEDKAATLIPAPKTPIRAGGKRQSRRNEGSLSTGTPPSPAMLAKGKKPALPSQLRIMEECGLPEQDEAMQLAGPGTPDLSMGQPQKPFKGRSRGNGRNRFGREHDVGNPSHAPTLGGSQEQAPGQTTPRGPAQRQRNGGPRRQVGFHLAAPQAPHFAADAGVHLARHEPAGAVHSVPAPLAVGAPHAPKPRYNRRQRRGGFDGSSENHEANRPREAVKTVQG